MTSYTIVNLMDVEDTVSVPEIEGRFGRSQLGSDHLGVSFFRYAPGHRGRDGHRHREQEETYVVVEGSGRILLDGDVHELRQWDVVRIAPRTFRALEAGPDGLAFVAIGSDRPEGGDGEPSRADWPD